MIPWAINGFQQEQEWLGIVGFDFYGFAEAQAWHGREGPKFILVVSTYCGYGPAEFGFQPTTPLTQNEISVSATAEDQALEPMAVHPPHWFQRFPPFN